MKIKIHLDLDGVLANFSKQAAEYLNIEYPKEEILNHDWVYDCGVSKSQFYKKIVGQNFWETIQPYPWAKDLAKEVHSISKGNWVFCTKAIYDEGCYSGKYLWIKKHFPKFAEKLWICQSNKGMMARCPQDILIDDDEKNRYLWEQNGGTFFSWQEVTDDYDIFKISQRFSDLSLFVEKLKK